MKKEHIFRNFVIQVMVIILFVFCLYHFFPMDKGEQFHNGVDDKKKPIESEEVKKEDKPSSGEIPSEKPVVPMVLKANMEDIQIEQRVVSKNEKISILFTVSSNQAIQPKYAIINDNKYQIEAMGNHKYCVVMDGISSAGYHTIFISRILLEDGREIQVSHKAEVFVERSIPSVVYEKKENEQEGSLSLLVSLRDIDDAMLTDMRVILKDMRGNVIADKVVKNQGEVLATELMDSNYLLSITGTYKAGIHIMYGATLREEKIHLNSRFYTFKDISDVKVYEQVEGKVVALSDTSQLVQKNPYLVELSIRGNSTIYAELDSIISRNDKTYLRLKGDRVVSYQDGERKPYLEVPFPFTRNASMMDELKSLEGYEKEKETLYSNLLMLMPFYDEHYLIQDGSRFLVEHFLNHKEIQSIMPVIDGKMAFSITDSNYKKVNGIKILFTNGELLNYKVKMRSYVNHIANYDIPDLNLMYNYKNMVIQDDSPILKELVTMMQNYQYETDIYPVKDGDKTERDYRLYRDYFDDTIRLHASDFIEKLSSNYSSYGVYLDNTVLRSKILEELQTDDWFQKILYAYQYIDRWYRFEIGNMKMSDALFFDGGMLGFQLSTKGLVLNVVNKASINDLAGNRTVLFYNQFLNPYTDDKTFIAFLENAIAKLEGEKNPSDWFASHFNGVIVEMPSSDKNVRYRAWEHMKYNQSQTILPFLSIPSRDMYILSAPTQLLFGSMNVYSEYNPKDDSTREVMREKIIAYGRKITRFYDTTGKIIYNSTQLLNKKMNMQVDRRVIWGQLQDPKTTEEPIVKNIYVPLGLIAAANGSGAYANGYNVFWVVYQALNGFNVFTHETAHNQDGSIFLEGRGRRSLGYAEDYADGNINQTFNDGSLNMNLTYEFELSSNITSNLSYKRIDSPDKIYDFYHKMFETINSLDYLEGQSFLRVNSSVKSSIGVQHSYPKLMDVNATDRGLRDTSKWSYLDSQAFDKMQLHSMEDLWDNQINLKPGVADGATLGPNRYGGENIYGVNWYQPHNDYGRPNSYAFKRLAFEMLGEGGYTNGYVTYYSNKNPNDLAALRDVTGNDSITWKEYKLGKYREVEENLSKTPYFQGDSVIEIFRGAMELDWNSSLNRSTHFTNNARNILYHYLQRVTDDFRSGIYDADSDVIHIYSASQFIEAMKQPYGHFVLENDIDFSNYHGSSSIIDTTFIGRLDGKGHRIKGLSIPLFREIKYSYITNVIFDDNLVDLKDDNVGLLSKTSTSSIMDHISIMNSSVTGDVRVGGLVGSDTKSIFYRVSVDAVVVVNQDRGGSIVAETNGSMILYSYSKGRITQVSNVNAGGWHIGGLVGRVYNHSGVHSCYSATYVEQKNMNVAKSAGGLFGKVEGQRSIMNNFSVSDGVNFYRIDGHSNRNDYASGYYNNYEYGESNGKSNLGLVDFSMDGKIDTVTKEALGMKSFYVNQLGWNASIWDFRPLESGMLPILSFDYLS